MTRAELLAELYTVLNADTIAPPGGWSEPLLLRYLAEGQDKFCEETGFFRDIDTYQIALRAGVSLYAVSDRVIQILDIWDGLRKLGKVQQDSIVSDTWPVDFGSEVTGRPILWQTDQSTGFVKLFPTPTAAETSIVLALHTWRYSKYDLAGDGPVPEEGPTLPADPEIPSRFQRACIEWAAYKAFNHHDMEAQDPVKAVDHLRMFDAYVADGVRAFRRRHNIETRVGADPAYRT